ncbi:MAG: serine hydrolase domain-containing protein [Anaerolineae bacterium]
MNPVVDRVCRIWGTALLCLLLPVGPALAQDAPARAAIDAAELERFVDAFFAEQMAARHIPGAAFVLVQGNDMVLSKGYGYADLENETPVDPERTIFRLGSVGKLFTAVAALQLVEQDRLDLHTDVNRYLTAFAIPETYPEPITLHHLLTHTAGFDDDSLGYSARSPKDRVSLADYVAGSVPPRLRPPGEVHNYCNYCFDLTGYLVEEVSGLPFARYVEERILQPLGMGHTTFIRPLPPALAADRAVGYLYRNGAFKPVPATYQRSAPGPAGSLSAPAAEMAPFMIALLGGGAAGGQQILEPQTAAMMRQQQFSHHPTLPGLGYAFEEGFVNDLRVAAKGGDDPPFSAELVLIPEQKVGFLVVSNAPGIAFRGDLLQALADHYFPAPAGAPLQTTSLSRDQLQRLAGAYRYTRYSHTTANKLNGLALTFEIRANADGTLSSIYPLSGEVGRYAPETPKVFRRVSGGPMAVLGHELDIGDTLVFREDGQGRITYLFVPFKSFALERLAWYEGTAEQVLLLAAMVLLFLSAVVVWPLGWLLGRLHQRTGRARSRGRRARWLAGLVGGLNLLFLVGCLPLILSGALAYGASPLLIALLVLPILTGVLALLLVVLAAIAWKDRLWTLVSRIHYSLVALAAVAFAGWAAYWNLLGFHL